MNRVVVITGASCGLGFSLAKKFLEQGDEVFGISRNIGTGSSRDRFQTHFIQTCPWKNRYRHFRVDLTSEAAVKKFVRIFGRLKKRVDILINNAGSGGSLERIEDISAKQYREVLDGNLLPAFLMSKHFIPLFRKRRGGLILNISSMAGQRAVPRLFSYSAAKFAILALSQCLAKENADKNLKCITICPGGMNTRMRAELFGTKDAERQQSPDFVADVILKVIDGKIKVESGGDIVIRHGKVTAIRPCPGE